MKNYAEKELDQSQNSFKQNSINSNNKNDLAEMLDIKSKAGHTPFFTAVIRGHLEIADLLLETKMSSIDI